MGPYLLPAVIAALLGALALLFRQGIVASRRGSSGVRRVATGAVALPLAWGLLVSCAPPRPQPAADSSPGSAMLPEARPLPSSSFPKGPLVAGTKAPSLEARGWLNGPPPIPGKGPRAIVVDLWAHW
jgi:hypothetical protein